MVFNLVSVVHQMFFLRKNVPDITKWEPTHAANFMQQYKGYLVTRWGFTIMSGHRGSVYSPKPEIHVLRMLVVVCGCL